MRAKIFGMAAVLAALGVIAPASADVTVTYTGTLGVGSDQSGVFGPGNTSLTGDSFTVQYVFDPTLGDTYSSLTENYAKGGTTSANANPALSASVTINGVTVSIGVPNSFGEIYGYNDGSTSEQYHEADYTTSNIDNYVYIDLISTTPSLPASITGPLNYTTGPDDYALGYFQISNGVTGQLAGGYVYSVSTLTISSGIPEPSTWAMMLTGFAGLGFAAFRRGQRAKASFAA
jgi:hypothetical protein